MARSRIEATPERIGSLPLWAREHIGSLSRRLASAEADRQELADGIGETGTSSWVLASGLDDKTIRIPRFHTPRLYLPGPPTQVPNYLEARPTDDGQGLLVRVGHGQMTILPHASNSVTIRPERN